MHPHTLDGPWWTADPISLQVPGWEVELSCSPALGPLPPAAGTHVVSHPVTRPCWTPQVTGAPRVMGPLVYASWEVSPKPHGSLGPELEKDTSRPNVPPRQPH